MLFTAITVRSTDSQPHGKRLSRMPRNALDIGLEFVPVGLIQQASHRDEAPSAHGKASEFLNLDNPKPAHKQGAAAIHRFLARCFPAIRWTRDEQIRPQPAKPRSAPTVDRDDRWTDRTAIHSPWLAGAYQRKPERDRGRIARFLDTSRIGND